MTLSDWSYEQVPLADGRSLEVLLHGPRDRVLVWWTGTPGGAVPHPRLADLCDRLGLGILMPLRPGYGQSTPLPGRRIADPPADVAEALKHLDIPAVISIGFSGGGPHALASAALLPQCVAAGVVVSPAPRDAEGIDFYDGMGLSNQEEWRLADEGEAAVRPWLEQTSADLRENLVDGFTTTFSDLLCAPDAAALANPARKQMMAASLQKALETGYEGWLADDIAMTTPWGFDLGSIAVPVAFWTGRQDRMVSYQHTLWMSQEVPGSDLHVIAADGHISLGENHLEEMLQDLVDKAGW